MTSDTHHAAEQAGGSQRVLVEEGEWQGWYYSTGDAFNAHVGPFYYRDDENGARVCAMRAEARHLNGGGMMHGGALMTFADYCLYAFASILGDPHMVTASFNSEFVGAVPPGAIVECRGEVIRSTRSMVFLRGLMTVEGETVLSFSGILKKVRPKS
ncbi:MAG TPA: PaaI family thioesterase [Pedomonas sp.]|uniref:PaaI family thioesterase n=1 Tax=Pedomonas sp. TaxID=2976421 RepID=UPI002F3F382B